MHARADESSARTSNKFLLRQFDLPKTAPTVRIIKLSQSLLNKNRRKSSKKARKQTSSEDESGGFSMSTERSFEFEH
ncbi:unnamed protein product [Auanema sp. JU1783]|nr:unnamed protein product [Auanema sp. JU1783]